MQCHTSRGHGAVAVPGWGDVAVLGVPGSRCCARSGVGVPG